MLFSAIVAVFTGAFVSLLSCFNSASQTYKARMDAEAEKAKKEYEDARKAKPNERERL